MSFHTEMRVLKKLQFFACLPEKQLRHILFEAEKMRLNKGRVLFDIGDKAECGYVLLGGQINLFQTRIEPETHEPENQIVAEIHAGTLLGGFALVSDKTWETGGYIAQKCDVLRIDCRKFRKLLQQDHNMRHALTTYFETNFQNMMQKLITKTHYLAQIKLG